MVSDQIDAFVGIESSLALTDHNRRVHIITDMFSVKTQIPATVCHFIGVMMLLESQAVCSTHSALQYTVQEVMFALCTMDLLPHMCNFVW